MLLENVPTSPVIQGSKPYLQLTEVGVRSSSRMWNQSIEGIDLTHTLMVIPQAFTDFDLGSLTDEDFPEWRSRKYGSNRVSGAQSKEGSTKRSHLRSVLQEAHEKQASKLVYPPDMYRPFIEMAEEIPYTSVSMAFDPEDGDLTTVMSMPGNYSIVFTYLPEQEDLDIAARLIGFSLVFCRTDSVNVVSRLGLCIHAIKEELRERGLKF